MSFSPLSGIVVVDASQSIAGAVCGKVLADGGVYVIKVERRDGDHRQCLWERNYLDFLNADKHVVVLDYESEAGRGELEELLAGAHLVLTSDTHREARHIGLDCTSLLRRHPELVSACITPFGQSGPYTAYSANDSVISALSGLADCTPGFPDRQEEEGEPPVQSLAPLAEMGAGLTAGVAVLGALFARLRGLPAPRHIEISALEAVVWMMVSEWGLFAYGGGAPGRTRKSRTLEPNCYVPCRDGFVVIVATSDKHWQALVEIMGSPQWALESRFRTVEGRARNAGELQALLRRWTLTQGGREIMEAAQVRGVPCVSYLELRETIATEHVQKIGSLRSVCGRLFPADPIEVNGSRRTLQRTAPSHSSFSRRTVPASLAPPLAGVRVVDLSQMVAGPLAGQLLAALGAEVIIVESRAHLVSRQFGPFRGEPKYDGSTNFNHANRGKRSVEIDLSTSTGRHLLDKLVSSSDVVLENLSKRAVEHLGLTYQELRRNRENLIVASISAFGRMGPWGSYVSHHGGVATLSGLASVTRDEQDQPRIVGAIFPDVLAGTYMALAIEQALAAREQTGCGCHVEVGMLDVLLTCMGGLIPAAAGDTNLGPHPGRFLRSAEPGRFLAVAAQDFPLQTDLEAWVAARTRREAMEALQARGVKAGAVLDMSEVIADVHLRGRGFVEEVEHPVAGQCPLPAVPWIYDEARPVLAHAPLLGDSTADVMINIGGLTPGEVEELRWKGVLK